MFGTEQELARSLESLLSRVAARDTQLRLERELDAGNGVADLVMCCLLSDSDKTAKGLSQLNPSLAVLAATGDVPRNVSAATITGASGIGLTSARLLLAQMSSAGVTRKTRQRGVYRQVRHLAPVVDWIVAVEVKLTNWKRALYQAARYQDFANEAWVVLDHERAGSAIENSERFTRFNVGLATLDARRNLRIVFRPRFELPRSRTRWWAANVAIAERLIGVR